METERKLHSTISIDHKGYYHKLITRLFKLLILRPGLYIPTRRAVIIDKWRIVRKFLREKWIRRFGR